MQQCKRTNLQRRIADEAAKNVAAMAPYSFAAVMLAYIKVKAQKDMLRLQKVKNWHMHLRQFLSNLCPYVCTV